MELLICKAEPTVEPIEDVTIRIMRPMPRFSSLESQGEFFDKQADHLAMALAKALAQGMYHRLLIRMLQHQVSYYLGPSLTVKRP